VDGTGVQGERADADPSTAGSEAEFAAPSGRACRIPPLSLIESRLVFPLEGIYLHF